MQPTNSADHLARLQALAAEAIKQFRASSLHNVHLDAGPIDLVKIVARQIGKYGGGAGWELACEIEAELEVLGEKPWR